MPTILTSTVLDEAAVYLNDPSKSRFTHAVLLPYIQRAFKQLQLEMHLNNVDTLREVSSLFTIPIGAKVITSQPTDLVEPISIEERDAGSTRPWNPPMERVDFLSNRAPYSHLGEWEWREEVINFIGATSTREIRVKYLKGNSITSTSSVIQITDADLYLAPYTAGLASKYIGENYERGGQLMTEGAANLNKVIRRNITKKQSLTARRRSFSRWLRRV